MRITTPLSLLPLLALSLAACGSGAVSTEDLESEVSDQIESLDGNAPDEVACANDLDAEVGAEVHCSFTEGDETYGMTLTVTEVVDDTAMFDIVLDDQPGG